MIAYVGTYTIGSESQGIYRFRYDAERGRLVDRELVAQTANPSFLAVDAGRRLLICVNETGDYEGRRTGAVSSFRINDALGLDPCCQVPSEGRAPCYVSIAGETALVANYVEGTVASFRIAADGSLKLMSVMKHSGTGPNEARQESAHAHSITPFPNGRFAVAADLGTDELIVYQLAGEELAKVSSISEISGAGPRHVAFTKDGTRMFLLNELNASLSVYHVEQSMGMLERLSSASTLPDDWSGDNLCADVHLSTDERFVYCSNRGHESLAVFRFDPTSDALERIQIIGCGGEHPRNFAISPDGRFLLCANQNTHTVVSFTIDPESGLLAATCQSATVPMPVCVTLVDEEAFG